MNNQSDVGLTNLSIETLTPTIKILHEDGQIMDAVGGNYKLSEAEKISLDDFVSNAETTTERVKNKVIEAAYDDGDDGEKERLWKNFHEVFIVPFIEESGAKSYELITGQYTGHKLY